MFPSKSALLADLEQRVIRVINVTKQADAVSEAAGVSVYLANVLNIERGTAQKQNVLFYVVDEGTATEQAYYQNGAGSRKELEIEAMQYLAGLAATYTRVQVQEVDTTNEFIICRAFKVVNDKLAEVRVMIYKDGNTATHREFAY